MTNPFRNFNDAMQCVIERGGKAWRESQSVYFKLTYESSLQPGDSKEIGCYGRTYDEYLCSGVDCFLDDLTATDWVWEEAR